MNTSTSNPNNSFRPVTLPYLNNELAKKYRNPDNTDLMFYMDDMKLEDNVHDMNHKMNDYMMHLQKNHVNLDQNTQTLFDILIDYDPSREDITLQSLMD